MADKNAEKILKPIGKRVKFKYPSAEGSRKGTLEYRAIVRSAPGRTGVPYWDVIDRIKFEGERERWLRITYYRKPKDRLIFGGQTALAEPIRVWKRILVKGAKEKKWFRVLLTNVMKELER